jgi:hypothetical protein
VTAGAVLVIGAAIVLLALIRHDPAYDARPNVPEAPPLASHPPSDSSLATPPDANPSREREQLFARVRESGPGDEPWTAQAGDVFAAIAKLGARVDPLGCYVVGCAATLRLDANRDHRRFVSDLDADDTYRAWTGGKRLTETEIAADGSVTIGLVLYRPD